jgi:hypothetical protein
MSVDSPCLAGEKLMAVQTKTPIRIEDVALLSISLEQGDTDLSACQELPLSEYDGTFYSTTMHPLSIAVLLDTGHEYEMACSTCARQNARAAVRRGYEYLRIDRAEWEDDLHAIRSSAPIRQGRAMHPAYMMRQTYSSDVWPEPHCKRHLVTVHGVVGTDGHLAAYMQLVQCGEIVRVNTILGHWDKLKDQVVWLLVMEALKWHIDECGASYALYYTHDSGHGPGLRYFKERFGFRPAFASWEFS